MNAFKGLGTSFLLCLGSKFGLQLLLTLVKGKANLASILKILKSRDTLQFALSFGALNFLYKMLLCTLRRVNVGDKKGSVIAGALCSLTLLLDKNTQRRQQLALYMVARSFETIVNLSETHQVVTAPKNWGHLMTTLMFSFFMYQLY